MRHYIFLEIVGEVKIIQGVGIFVFLRGKKETRPEMKVEIREGVGTCFFVVGRRNFRFSVVQVISLGERGKGSAGIFLWVFSVILGCIVLCSGFCLFSRGFSVDKRKGNQVAFRCSCFGKCEFLPFFLCSFFGVNKDPWLWACIYVCFSIIAWYLIAGLLCAWSTFLCIFVYLLGAEATRFRSGLTSYEFGIWRLHVPSMHKY